MVSAEQWFSARGAGLSKGPPAEPERLAQPMGGGNGPAARGSCEDQALWRARTQAPMRSIAASASGTPASTG